MTFENVPSPTVCRAQAPERASFVLRVMENSGILEGQDNEDH